MTFDIDYWVNNLGMQPHPEGGFFVETHRTQDQVLTKRGDIWLERSAGTAIYFLMPADSFSAFHRITADETWHFYYGDPLTIYELTDQQALLKHQLGANPAAGQHFQLTIPAYAWFASTVERQQGGAGYSLVGCTVSPGFEFADFELANADELAAQFPAHASLIRSLCR